MDRLIAASSRQITSAAGPWKNPYCCSSIFIPGGD
jgi:hypothetical protein